MHKLLLLALKSRNEIYSFSNFLKSREIYVSIINTPQVIGSSCTLSIKIDYKHLNQIVNILNKQRPKSFLGLYSITNQINGNQVLRIM